MNPVKCPESKDKSQSTNVEEFALTLSSLSEFQCILGEVPVPLKTFAVILTLLIRE